LFSLSALFIYYRNGATTDINSPIKTICLIVINKNNETCFATLNKLCIFAGKTINMAITKETFRTLIKEGQQEIRDVKLYDRPFAFLR
jgi:hypothetical protein